MRHQRHADVLTESGYAGDLETFRSTLADHLVALNGKYVLDVFKGIDVFGKLKFIYETDKRLNDARYLPYQPGDCPGNGAACANNKNYYSAGNTTADIYVNPDVITNSRGETVGSAG